MPCSTSSGLPLFGCCGGPVVKSGRVIVNASWLSYYPTAAFIDRQIATCVAYVEAYDFTTLPAERTNLRIDVNLAAGVELTAAMIDAAPKQSFAYDNHGEALNGSGWSSNVFFNGTAVYAQREILKTELNLRICRAVWKQTFNASPPPEYLNDFTSCATAVESAGTLTAAVLTGATDTYQQSPALRQSQVKRNAIWLPSAPPLYAPPCCNFAP